MGIGAGGCWWFDLEFCDLWVAVGICFLLVLADACLFVGFYGLLFVLCFGLLVFGLFCWFGVEVLWHYLCFDLLLVGFG